MNLVHTPVLHGGDDDLTHALAHLSWKEMAIGAGILLGFLVLVVLVALVLE